MKGMTALIVFLVIKDGSINNPIKIRPKSITFCHTFITILITGVLCNEKGLTPHELANVKHVQSIAAFGDAQHRGPDWYDYTSKSSGESGSDLKSSLSSQLSEFSAVSSSISTSQSSEASSLETTEKRLATRAYRVCTPCPHDMLKKFMNRGIKWICGGYQRARRSFKSGCMMRYRNCQDGTLFVKLYDHRCKTDPYHGRHWFYNYNV